MIPRLPLAIIPVLLFSSNCQSALILNLSGSVGSNVIAYEATGSITIGEAVSATSSSFGRAPVDGAWSSGYDNNIGDPIQNTASSQNNLDLSSDVSYLLNGTAFAAFDQIDLGAAISPGDDDIGLDPDGTQSYPSLDIGDIVSWSGNGTFTLASGTFDTFFIPGTYGSSLTGHTGDYEINITQSATAVPEPSSLIALGAIGIGFAFRRRKALQG